MNSAMLSVSRRVMSAFQLVLGKDKKKGHWLLLLALLLFLPACSDRVSAPLDLENSLVFQKNNYLSWVAMLFFMTLVWLFVKIRI